MKLATANCRHRIKECKGHEGFWRFSGPNLAGIHSYSILNRCPYSMCLNTMLRLCSHSEEECTIFQGNLFYS